MRSFYQVKFKNKNKNWRPYLTSTFLIYILYTIQTILYGQYDPCGARVINLVVLEIVPSVLLFLFAFSFNPLISGWWNLFLFCLKFCIHCLWFVYFI